MVYLRSSHRCYICKREVSGYGLKKLDGDKWVCRKGKCRREHDKKTKLIKPNVENLYKMLSFKGDFDIHRLKDRDPEMYKKIMNEKED